MTNPTSNFGWQMPTPTDLVTDLPADFEVFGQAVDTSMADLKGGTTGQILSKATNADMDFTWITNDVGDITAVNVTAPITGGGTSGAVTIGVSAASTSASGVVQLSDSTSTTSSVLASTPTATKSAYDLADTANTTANAAIAKSTVTTAGDIIYRNATVPTRLGIGTAGQVLTVNTGATAPEWKTPTAAASGLTLITRASFSNVANTGSTFGSVFSSTYKAYLIQIEQIYGASPSDDLLFTLVYSGTEVTTGYFGGSLGIAYNAATIALGNNVSAAFKITNRCGSSAYIQVGNINISEVGNGSQKARFTGQLADSYQEAGFSFGGGQGAAYSTTGFRFKTSSSNIYGTIAVYGLAV
jgi:hypothetical protein